MLYIKLFVMKLSNHLFDGCYGYQIWENLLCNQ